MNPSTDPHTTTTDILSMRVLHSVPMTRQEFQSAPRFLKRHQNPPMGYPYNDGIGFAVVVYLLTASLLLTWLVVLRWDDRFRLAFIIVVGVLALFVGVLALATLWLLIAFICNKAHALFFSVLAARHIGGHREAARRKKAWDAAWHAKWAALAAEWATDANYMK